MISLDDLGKGNLVVINDALDCLIEVKVLEVSSNGDLVSMYDGSSIIFPRKEVLAVRNSLGIGEIEKFPDRSYDFLNPERLRQTIEDDYKKT